MPCDVNFLNKIFDIQFMTLKPNSCHGNCIVMFEGIQESHWESFNDFGYGNVVTMATLTCLYRYKKYIQIYHLFNPTMVK